MQGWVLLAVSFGALRYRWEIPNDGVPGGPDTVADALGTLVGAKPMVRGVRRARRRG